MPRSASPTLLEMGDDAAAALVAVADWAAQRASEAVSGAAALPVGVVTGVAGGVHLGWLPRRERRVGRS